MTSRILTAALAAIVLAGAAAPAVNALAQDHRGGDHGGNRGGGRGGDGYRGGNYGANGLIAGLALGAALGNYGGHPYYCREHRNWRWSARYHHYVYYNGGRC